MIEVFYETDFKLASLDKYVDWVSRVIRNEDKRLGSINYVFCDDKYLLAINQKHLDHDTYTDIITFDYSVGDELAADIYISIERVRDNSVTFNQTFNKEVLRVMAHGVLHLCGYNDKNKKEKALMRSKEDESINMFHVEQ